MLCHDPRISDDREQKIETQNPVLMLAEAQRDMYPSGIDWDKVKLQADYCDQPVPGPNWSDYEKLKSVHGTGHEVLRWREW
jgi:hypothetical protein